MNSKNYKWKQNKETPNIKGKQLSNQFAIRTKKEKKSCACWACTKTGRERSSYKFACAFRSISRSCSRALHSSRICSNKGAFGYCSTLEITKLLPKFKKLLFTAPCYSLVKINFLWIGNWRKNNAIKDASRDLESHLFCIALACRRFVIVERENISPW